jgi:hypothetical protein
MQSVQIINDDISIEIYLRVHGLNMHDLYCFVSLQPYTWRKNYHLSRAKGEHDAMHLVQREPLVGLCVCI